MTDRDDRLASIREMHHAVLNHLAHFPADPLPEKTTRALCFGINALLEAIDQDATKIAELIELNNRLSQRLNEASERLAELKPEN